jgi:hypothetical protein
MNAADANQYFAAGSGFPDYMIFSVDHVESWFSGDPRSGFL